MNRRVIRRKLGSCACAITYWLEKSLFVHTKKINIGTLVSNHKEQDK